MPTHDYILDNQSGLAFRNDLNNNLSAIVSNNSSATEPTTTYAYMWWADTTSSILKIRNSSNTAWVEVLNLTTGVPLSVYTKAETDLALGDKVDTADIGTTVLAPDGDASQLANLPAGNLVDDLTPQLGGNLDTNNKDIVNALGAVQVDDSLHITGDLTVDGTVPGGLAGIGSVSEDLTPQLGGDLDVNGKRITTDPSAIDPTITIEAIGAAGSFNTAIDLNADDAIYASSDSVVMITSATTYILDPNLPLLFLEPQYTLTVITDSTPLDTTGCLSLEDMKISSQNFIEFISDGPIGSITGNDVSVSYNTTSDYRLKENIEPMSDCVERLMALKPIRFKWKTKANQIVDGFLAHEVLEVVPEAVTGIKDAMRAERYVVEPAITETITIRKARAEVLDDGGNVIAKARPARTREKTITKAVMGEREVPDYQGVDQSKIVPLLVGSSQELINEVNNLERHELGDYNTSVGLDALDSLDGGGSNVAVGERSLHDVTTGSQNVSIGVSNSSADRGVASNQIVIGYNVKSIGAGYITMGKNKDQNRVYNDFTTNAVWTRVSDERIKKEIESNEDCGLNFINDLSTVTYKFKAPSELDPELSNYDEEKTEAEYTDKMYGFIAQEVKEAMDSNNITDFAGHHQIDDGKDDMQGISYEMFVVPLVKSVQELSMKNEVLKQELATTNSAVADLLARIEALENQ